MNNIDSFSDDDIIIISELLQGNKTEESIYETCGVILTGENKGKDSKRYTLEIYENNNYRLEITFSYKHKKDSKFSGLLKDKIFNLIKK